MDYSLKISGKQMPALLTLQSSGAQRPIVTSCGSLKVKRTHHPSIKDRASCECFRALYNKPNIRFVALCVLCKETSSDLVRAWLKKYLLPNQEARLGRFIAEVFQINVRIAEASPYIAPVNQVAATRVLLRLPPIGQRRLMALPGILDVVSLQGLFPAIFGALRLYLSNIRQKTL